MSDESYTQFFNVLKDFKHKIQALKKQDYTDYNPLAIVQSPTSEVKMHSAILYSLLEVQGAHCKGDLFLRRFLESLNLKEWFGDTQNALVLREYKHIDIYITNGTRHIILENKIYANDAQNQLARYIKAIHNPQYGANYEIPSDESKAVDYENIAVIYLSPFGQTPSDDSLKDKDTQWQIKGNELKSSGESIAYRQISYKEHILSWIKSCQKEVRAIRKLDSALEFYKDIVQIITNTKEDKMSLETFLKENRNFIKIATEIKRLEIEEMCVNLFKSEVASKAEFSEWEFVNKGVAFGFCPKGYLKQTFKFMLTLEKTPASRYLGFRLHINGKDYQNDLPKRLKAIIEKHGFKLNAWGWWLCDESGKDMVDLTNESLEEYFTRRYKNANKLNDFLQNDSEIARLASEVK